MGTVVPKSALEILKHTLDTVTGVTRTGVTSRLQQSVLRF